MEKKFLYFQPQYVGKFKCDGAKCNARCCKGWYIDIDEATYKKYLQADSEIAAQFRFDAALKRHSLKKHTCPFLNEKKLCSLQLKYGEEFLSPTCATYPRYTRDFGKFFERSLTLTCPVAAELILFQKEPMRFELVEVSEKIHGNGGKIGVAKVQTDEGLAEYMLSIQIAMISILQERTLTIDQRLIVLGFFTDKLDEVISKKIFTESDVDILLRDLKKLISVYESKKFLSEQIPLMIRSISFDAEKFIEQIKKLFIIFCRDSYQKRKYIDCVDEILKLKSIENDFISVSRIVENYEGLADARKNFLEKYSTVLENYLVNELFMNVFPWKFEESIPKNFAVFIISYKIFELMMFSATQNGLTSEKDLLNFVDWFATKTDHTKNFYDRFFEFLKDTDDTFFLMTLLLKG